MEIVMAPGTPLVKVTVKFTLAAVKPGRAGEAEG